MNLLGGLTSSVGVCVVVPYRRGGDSVDHLAFDEAAVEAIFLEEFVV